MTPRETEQKRDLSVEKSFAGAAQRACEAALRHKFSHFGLIEAVRRQQKSN